MSAIYAQLRADIITAMKARDSVATTALRTADAAIKRAALDANVEIDDALVIATMRKGVKNLNDANTEFAKAGRDDLIAANKAEIVLLEKYLPQGLSAEKLEAAVNDAIATTGAATKREMGKVMAALKQHPQADVIDFGAASKLIQGKLS
ncbi:MAG: GatB/YqeY domain-containing protein [Cephaloticoccus sp.]|nr:GatB/YqeY domain-containing protein [Cephaloticoccus sp.]